MSTQYFYDVAARPEMNALSAFNGGLFDLESLLTAVEIPIITLWDYT
jgi:hypothetical protein